jgi:hypothetical protein
LNHTDGSEVVWQARRSRRHECLSNRLKDAIDRYAILLDRKAHGIPQPELPLSQRLPVQASPLTYELFANT